MEDQVKLKGISEMLILPKLSMLTMLTNDHAAHGNDQHNECHLWVKHVNVLRSEDGVVDEVEDEGDCEGEQQRGLAHPVLPPYNLDHLLRPAISQSVGLHTIFPSILNLTSPS